MKQIDPSNTPNAGASAASAASDTTILRDQVRTERVPASSPPVVQQSPTNPLVTLNVTRQLDMSLSIDGLVVVTLFLLALSIIFWRAWKFIFHRSKDFEINEAEFGLGQQKIKLKPNDDDRQIAYKIWVELSTRKIGLPIDLEQDVIVEVYESWHTFFSVTRELIKDVPVRKYQRDSTAKIVRLSIEVLNEGLRPHLTKWQARFRRWYEHAVQRDQLGNAAPQEIQREFPAFSDLTEDLKLVNARLIAYRSRMHDLMTSQRLVRNSKGGLWHRMLGQKDV